MLTRADGATGRNFLTPEIAEFAKRRIAHSTDLVEPFRLLHNMLSSQPMCFNLFAPLALDHDRAARLLGALFPGEGRRVLNVEIEYAPARRYLGDGTSFDAFVDFERIDGTRTFLAIETKLTDRLSPYVYDRPTYRATMARARHVWREGAGIDARVADARHNQLWRNHLLLALALSDDPESPFAACMSVVVRHPLDEEGAEAVAGYRSLLRDVDPHLPGTERPRVPGWRVTGFGIGSVVSVHEDHLEG